MKNNPFTTLLTAALFSLATTATAQLSKPKSYIISKEKLYTIDVQQNKPSVVALAREKKWVGDKDNGYVSGSRIGYVAAFEEVSDIEAFSIGADKKKVKVRNIYTEEAQIENIFHHDMKYKTFSFFNLDEGSETYMSYRKEFRKPHFLDAFYFRDGIETKDARIELKVSKDVEIGYLLRGADTDKVSFHSEPDGDYTKYSWQMLDAEKDEFVADAPDRSYWSPHLIFYIKTYKSTEGIKSVVGSIDNLYSFYYDMTSGINKTDQSAVKAQALSLTENLQTDAEKAKAIFDYVQTKVNYVAFEEGMGGFVPREAAEVYQKKYGDCKDMSNLLNEMLKYAGIESYTAWIGTRNNNYTYEKVPAPIVDNHMITVAKIEGQYIFLDATGQYTLFPGYTAFIQGKQALLRIGADEYEIVPVPTVPATDNKMTATIKLKFDGSTISGHADFSLSGYLKSQFNSSYQPAAKKDEMLRNYLSRFINNMAISEVHVENADLSQNELQISHDLIISKWAKEIDGKILFKPALLFPYADSRVADDRKVPIEFSFNKAFDLNYEFTVPDGYSVEFLPKDFSFANDLIKASVKYSQKGDKIKVSQTLTTHALLLEKPQFEEWNLAIKNITKQYNQNIILSKS